MTAAIKSVRDALVSDAALTAFWLAHYGKPATHRIGYKQSANAADFPVVSLVSISELINAQTGTQEVISIVIGVCNPGITDGIFDGVARVAEAKHWVLSAIAPFYAGEARVVKDRGERHPFYELEITVRLKYRRPGRLVNSID